jgi:cyclopropane fatty-acyl-phospholipid synthase-like methyltransferase
MEHGAETIEDGYAHLIANSAVREYYGDSDFMNYGFWREDTKSQAEASENLMEELLAFIPEKTGTILDVACGKGETSRYLTRYYPPQNVVAINFAKTQLEICRKKSTGWGLCLMDATKLGFQECSFDNLISVEAAQHFNTRKRFLLEAYRILKPGGKIVLSDVVARRELFREGSMYPPANYLEDIDAYNSLLKEVGFLKIEIRDETDACWNGCFVSLMQFWGRKFRRGETNYLTLRMIRARLNLIGQLTRNYLLLSAEKPA